VDCEKVLDFKRRDPFAADLNNILNPVGNFDVVVFVFAGNIAGVEIAAAPEIL